jgi:hypothetical protein
MTGATTHQKCDGVLRTLWRDMRETTRPGYIAKCQTSGILLLRHPGRSQTIRVATTLRSQSQLARKTTKFLKHTTRPIPHHTCNASIRDVSYRGYHVQSHAFIMPRLPLPALRTLHRCAASLDRRYSASVWLVTSSHLGPYSLTSMFILF